MTESSQSGSIETSARVVDRLLNSDDPSIRYKARTKVLGHDSVSGEMFSLRNEIRSSPRVRALLSERRPDGTIPGRPYAKWYGAHWVLVTLADLGYPLGDEDLVPLREQVLGWLLSDRHKRGIKSIAGRVRRCASQEGNALYALLTLGLADERCEELAQRLMACQWPDGGWNCDKRPEASISSFMESLIPMRALALYAAYTASGKAYLAARSTAELFLTRSLFRRRHDGAIIADDFVRLHYPCYWHYDILFGLKVMAEAGFVCDARCEAALDLLEAKRLADGGFPAEAKYYSVTAKSRSGRSLVDWGGASVRRMNEFVTVDALYVLRESGRITQCVR